MTEPQSHPEEDRILQLALGEVTGPDRDELTVHLAACPPCRKDYDELATAIEQALAAVPRLAPPAGFEDRVLGALYTGSSSPGRRRLRWRAALPAVAAAVIGLLAGVGLTLRLTGDEPPRSDQVVVATGAAALTTPAGVDVGSVSRSLDRGTPVLVVEVSDGPAGNRYLCRLVLSDGSTRDVGEWELDPQRANSWVVPSPDPGVQGVQLIGESGAVWSSADL